MSLFRSTIRLSRTTIRPSTASLHSSAIRQKTVTENVKETLADVRYLTLDFRIGQELIK